MFLRRVVGWSLISFILTQLISSSETKTRTGPEHRKLVVCYISTWAVYRPSVGAYSIENFDANLCTHAVYAFAGLDIAQSAIKSLDPWQDLKDNFGKGGYERLTNLKQNYPHLKVSLAIGGWNEGSKNYSILAADPFKRSQFVQQVTNFIKTFNFDGLDLDWEYPTERGGVPADRENFVQLVKELREGFNGHNLLLTSAIGSVKKLIDQAYDIKQLSHYLDYLHLMCYDYHGSWDGIVGYNAPLRAAADDVITVEYTINYLLKMGAPAQKLVLGLPFYGRTFKSPGDGKHGAISVGTGFQGPYTREDGFLGYNEICQLLQNRSANWVQIWDDHASQMLAHSERDGSDGNISVVTFDNPRSIANKILFAMEHELAGVMIWSVDTDDFRGNCFTPTDTYADYKYQPTSRRTNFTNYVLLRTVNEATVLALEAINNDFNRDTNFDNKVSSTESIPTDGNREHGDNGDKNVIDDTINEIPHGTIYDRKTSVGNLLQFSPMALVSILSALYLSVYLNYY